VCVCVFTRSLPSEAPPSRQTLLMPYVKSDGGSVKQRLRGLPTSDWGNGRSALHTGLLRFIRHLPSWPVGRWSVLPARVAGWRRGTRAGSPVLPCPCDSSLQITVVYWS